MDGIEIIMREVGKEDPVTTVKLNKDHGIVNIVDAPGSVLGLTIISMQPQKGFPPAGTGGHSLIENPVKPGNPDYPQAFAEFLEAQFPGYKVEVHENV